MNPNQTADCIAQVAAAWPNPVMTPLMAEAWRDTLAPLDYSTTRDALRELMATSAYRPTPEDVARAAGRTPAQARAFEQYLDAMRRPHCPPLDPAVRKIMNDLGGWAYCHAQSAEWHHRMFPPTWRRFYYDSDPLTEPVAALPAAPQDRTPEPTGTAAERRAYASDIARQIRAGWRNSEAS